ncbi:MAG: cysteine hydrolase family protein [Acidimicrobiales bacterium]
MTTSGATAAFDDDDSRWWESAFSDDELAIYDRYRRPRVTDFPWQSCAIVVIDVTMAFLGSKVSTLEACAEVPTACGLPGWQAVDKIARLLAAARSASVQVIYTNPDWSSEGYLGGATSGAVRELAADATTVPEQIEPQAGDYVLYKPKASALFETSLLPYCVRNGVRGLVLTGGTTSGCVRSTALEASAYGLGVAVVSDGCFDRSRLSEAVALFEMDAKYARVVSTDHAITRLIGA